MPAVRGQQGGAGVARYRAVDGASYLRLVSLCTVLGAAVGSVGAAAVLLIGLVGFAAATVAFAVFEMLNAAHVERVLSGLFAAAVTPVALAAVSDLLATKVELGRRLTFVSLAGISEFLLGLTLGVALTRGLGGFGGATGALALIAALVVTLPVRVA